MRHQCKRLRKLLYIMVAASLAQMTLPFLSEGQQSNIIGNAVRPGSDSAATQVTPPQQSGNTFNHFIQGGAQVGSNLYHSFGTFNLLGGESAVFRTPGDHIPNGSIAHILARVQSTSGSTIDGIVNSKQFYPSARLWIMSPNGITIGPHAQFSVGAGYINLTTASYLKNSDGATFYAFPGGNQQSTFSTAPVSAFGFTGPSGTIAFQSETTLNLTTNPADPKTLAIVAGRITTGNQVSLTAARGRFELATITNGEIIVKEQDPGPYLQTNNLGSNIQFLNDVTIDAGPTGLVRVGTEGPGTVGFTAPQNTTFQFDANRLRISPAVISSFSPPASPIEDGLEGQCLSAVLSASDGRLEQRPCNCNRHQSWHSENPCFCAKWAQQF
jgi:filamentous hemagglutinin family protein